MKKCYSLEMVQAVFVSRGFELVIETKYTPHYIKRQKRCRNQSLRKTPEERLTGKTEWELRQDQGYDRIWDCGHRTYDYVLKKERNRSTCIINTNTSKATEGAFKLKENLNGR